MNPSFRPLVDLCQEPVFKFLSIEPRKKMARKCPGFRKLHRELPFHFKVVDFYTWEDETTTHLISLDGANWNRQKCLKEPPSGVWIEPGKIRLKDPFVRDFFRYYFRREGTTVGKFDAFQPDIQFCLEFVKIVKLHIKIENSLQLFFLNYKNVHFKEVVLESTDLDPIAETWSILEDSNLSTDLLVIKNTLPFRISSFEEYGNHRITRKVHFVVDSWYPGRTVADACENFLGDTDNEFLCGTQFKLFLHLDDMPKEDWMDQLQRRGPAREFKYSEDRIGVCVEMTGNRELFIYYQIINDEHLFTAEILEKGTTKHYHQLPVDQQKKFRDKEDDRNRIRVIIDNDKADSPSNQKGCNFFVFLTK